MEIDILTLIVKFFHAIGLDNPAEASGWAVAAVMGVFSYWRITVMDKKYDEVIDKIKEALEKEEREWRALIAKTDDMTFEVLKTTTNTMTLLTEKINTLQMILLQYNTMTTPNAKRD